MVIKVKTLTELFHIPTSTEVEVGPVLILTIRDRESQVSKHRFRSVRVRDNTTTLNLNSFFSSSKLYTRLEELTTEMVINAQGHWNPDYPSIELQDFTIRDDVTAEIFLDSQLRKRVTKQLEELTQSVIDPYCHQLLVKIFEDPERKVRFLSSPASHSHHHAYPSGLALHSLEVVDYCDRFSDLSHEVNRDWLVTCALVHDIGKIWVYDNAGELTDEGKLKGHVILGYELLTRMMDEIKDLPKKLRQELEHSIVSHMGKEGKFGSYASPSTPIALIVNKMDELSTELARL